MALRRRELAQPSIAAVIPVYNAGDLIIPAVESVLNQDVPAAQIIIIDDGSTDDPTSRLGPLAEKVTMVVQPNCGVSSARNHGARLVESDYVSYLDADDMWRPDKLATISRVIRLGGAPDVIIDDFNRIDRDGQKLPANSAIFPFYKHFGEPGLADGIQLRKLAPGQFMQLLIKGYPVYPSALTIRTDVLSAVGGWNELIRRSEDFDLGLRLAMEYSLTMIEKQLTVVRRHEGHGDDNSYLLAALEGDFRVLIGHINRLAGYCQHEPLIGRRLLGMAWGFRCHGRPEEARVASLMALRFRGNRLRAAGALVKALMAGEKSAATNRK